MINNKPPTKGSWSKTEDEKLMAIVDELGGNVKNWTDISKKMIPFTRTPKQCRERYHQNLKPNLNKEPITEEEGEKINQMVIKHGKKWAYIARSLNNGRSDNTVKNWWNLKEGKKKRMKAKLEREKKSTAKPIETPGEELKHEEKTTSNMPLDQSMAPDGKFQHAYMNGLNMNYNHEWMSNELAKSNLIGMPMNNYAQLNLRLYESNANNRNSIFNQNIFNSNPNEPSIMEQGPFMKNGMSNSFTDLAKYNMQLVPQFMNGRMQSVDHFVPSTLSYSPASNGSNNEQRRISVAHSALSASNNLPMIGKEDDRVNRTRESSILALNQTLTNNSILPISRRASQFFLQQQGTEIMNDKYRQGNIIFKQPFVQGVPQNNIKMPPQPVKNTFSTAGVPGKPDNGVFKSNYTMNQTPNKDGRRRSTLANILNNNPE